MLQLTSINVNNQRRANVSLASGTNKVSPCLWCHCQQAPWCPALNHSWYPESWNCSGGGVCMSGKGKVNSAFLAAHWQIGIFLIVKNSVALIFETWTQSNCLAYLATFLLDSLLPALDRGTKQQENWSGKEKKGWRKETLSPDIHHPHPSFCKHTSPTDKV